MRIEQHQPIGRRSSKNDLSPVTQYPHRKTVAMTTPHFADVLPGVRQEVPAVAPQGVAAWPRQVGKVTARPPR